MTRLDAFEKEIKKMLHYIALFVMEYLLGGRSRSGVGVGVGVGIFRPESESESGSLKIRRLRSPDLICRLEMQMIFKFIFSSIAESLRDFPNFSAICFFIAV